MAGAQEILDLDDREVRVSNPDKVFFPAGGITKMALIRYYLSVMPGVLVGCHMRPSTLYRWPNGVGAPDDAFFQKRVPKHRPEWLETETVTFPSGRSAEMLVMADAAHVVWALNTGAIDLNPWPVRRTDVDHPDELRVDLDPTPGIPYSDVCAVAPVVRDVLDEHGLRGWPKTLGQARHAHLRSHRAAMVVHRGAPRCPRARARGRAAYAGRRYDRVVEGRAQGSIRRLQPERSRPHYRIGLLRPPGR